MRLWAFIDQHYHRAPHGGLMGQSPAEIFDLHSDRSLPLLAKEKLQEALTVRERRRVNKDSTLSVAGTVWELDQGFLAGRVVTVLRGLFPDAGPPQVEHEGKLLTLHPVDPVRNGKRRRLEAAPPASPPTVPFDPPSALLDRACGRSAPSKPRAR